MTASRKLSAVMFTDIMGYTHMMQTDENKGLQLVEYYRITLGDLAGQYGGQVLKNYGDGSLTLFDSIIGAIHCAQSLQKEFLKDPKLPVRLGIHLGDLTVQDNDVYGDGVNIASRLESVSIPGSVIFSRRVKEELDHHADIKCKPLGSFRLKNVSTPMEIFALDYAELPIPSRHDILNSPKVIAENTSLGKIPKAVWFGLFIMVMICIYWITQKTVQQGMSNRIENSIAVLPFLDLSMEGDQEWFCDGLTEQITSNLVRLENLKVISRTSSMKYKKTDKSIAEIGKELKVNHVLEGSVRKSSDKIRITTQLINVADDFHIWEKDFDKVPSDFFEIQDEVSTAIANALANQMSVGITPGDPDVLKNISPPTKNLLALKNYQLGRQYYDLYDSWASFDFMTPLRYFDASIAADSMYADAYIGKANLLLSVAWRKNIDLDSVKPVIESCIDRAISLNPTSGLPYVSKGYLHYLYDFDFDRAETHYQKAIGLAPNYDIAYAKYFWLNLALGKFQDARKLADKAIALNPLNSGYYTMKAEAYWAEMKLDSAVALYQKNLELFPNDPYSTWGLACSYGWAGKYDTAIKIINSIPGYQDNNFAAAYFAVKKGDTVYAKEILEKLIHFYEQNPNSWTWHIAAVYAALGELDNAMNYLEKDPIDFIYVAHWYKPLRKHPRFIRLLKNLGFDPSIYLN
ncbi:MAG: adenylate/guanylate cyclase domain-containing protein [Bacteroidia bacterium]|nr:adenylate/guanylate cyclase domain-containing protein [Bacteroidia bacterium]